MTTLSYCNPKSFFEGPVHEIAFVTSSRDIPDITGRSYGISVKHFTWISERGSYNASKAAAYTLADSESRRPRTRMVYDNIIYIIVIKCYYS